MGYDEDRLNMIFNKTGGFCRHCQKQLSWNSYGSRDSRGGWEVDHSHARASGGTDNLRNLWPLCWNCNLDKSSGSGTKYDGHFEARTTAGRIVERFGGRAGQFGTDRHRDYSD